MLLDNMANLLVILCLFIIIPASYSFENHAPETNDDIIQSYIIKPILSHNTQHSIMNKPMPMKTLHERQLQLAAIYPDWIETLQAPADYARSKRFWLFAKKDEDEMNVDEMPHVNKQQNSLTQGLWRSGIVGRRRRR